MSIQIRCRIEESLRDDLRKIATEAYNGVLSGNLSAVVRLALEEFRNSWEGYPFDSGPLTARPRPHAARPASSSPDPSS